MVADKISRTESVNGEEGASALRLLIKRILAGSLVILFIGVCSFAILFLAMCLQ